MQHNASSQFHDSNGVIDETSICGLRSERGASGSATDAKRGQACGRRHRAGTRSGDGCSSRRSSSGSVLMMIMGLIFPPVGMVAFVVSAVGRVDVTTVYRGTSVLLVAVIITTALLMAFPEIALFLPSRIG